MFDKLQRSAAYANWLFNPLQSMPADAVYDLLGEGALTREGLYLNLGYWAEANDLDGACRALVRLVADAAPVRRGDHVVDCGFGFADQDILIAGEYAPGRITGLNVTASQVERAQRRVADAGWSDVIALEVASATAMPLEAESADVVIALESAFHFHTRDEFFREAARVLRPGGRCVTADIVPLPTAHDLPRRLRQQFSWETTAAKFAIPPANAYDISEYRSRLAGAGFDEVRVRSIRDAVYAPLHGYMRRHPLRLRRLHPVAQLAAGLMLLPPAELVFGGLDYVLAVGVKPAA
jgi:cyclopropane fatty-acyl-phospholipid synthase-like methyltransferase